MQPIRQIVALDEVGRLTLDTAAPLVGRILEHANPQVCACGTTFDWKRRGSSYCSEACKKRAKRRRDDPAVGSPERRLNQRDALDMLRLVRDGEHVPGAVVRGVENDRGDHRTDDRPSHKLKERLSARGRGMAARPVRHHDSSPPPELTSDPFWRAVQYGARLVGEERKNEKPKSGAALARLMERHEQRQERKRMAATRPVEANRLDRIAAMEQRLDEILRLSLETVERLRTRFPTDGEVSAAVDRFLATTDCGVEVFRP